MNPNEYPYANDCRAAVSLTFDDGLSPQLNTALPIVNDRGMLCTFYVQARDAIEGCDDWAEILRPWKDVALQGHEIGNHTRSHICSRAFRNDFVARTLEDLTLSDIEADVLEAERRLNEIIGPGPRSFAYPCYQNHVGEGLTHQSYVPMIARHFAAARTRGEFANFPLTCSLTHLWSYNVEGMAGSAVIQLIERAVSLNQWCILAIHGIEVGNLAISVKAFQEVCDYLAARREDIWVAPVIEVADRIISWRASVSDAQSK
jgi:peptidoglycan-N-acetylglucosamine deacetylase